MIRTFLRASVPAALLVFAVACGGAPSNKTGDTASSGGNASAARPTSAPSSSDAKPTSAPPSSEAKPTSAPASEDAQPTTAPSSDSQSETRAIKDIDSTLDSLKSYRMRFTFAFDGKDKDGKAQKGSIEILQEYIKDSNDRRMRYTTQGDLGSGASPTGKGGSFEMIQIGQSSYIYSPDQSGEQKCVGFSSSDQSAQQSAGLFKPTDIVGGVDKARLVGRGEQINGILADHYAFDQGGLTFGAFGRASGDAWIAQDGGFVVKYSGQASGKSGLLGQTEEGTFTWEYNIEDANKIEAIDLPKECASQKPADDIPLPPNATEKSSFGSMQTFKTTDAPAAVADFFKKELTAKGWKAGEENAMGDLVMLQFTKDSRKLSITITKDEKGTSVIVTEEKGS